MDTNALADISVLYVEDDAAARQEVLQMLRRRIPQVISASNGSEGLEMFRENNPDLVITDIRMPVMNGLEMVREIKAINRATKIIITTAHSDMSFMLDAIDIGVDHYVLKPVETGKLFDAINACSEIIKMRRAEKKHQEEREQLISELQSALQKVKLLSGLLPICASCKKIRDDKGYWQQIESYIRDHSEAEFSHGICPECVKKLYPDFTGK